MSSSEEKHSLASNSESSESTKVYYYLDDNATPYVSVLPVAAEKATLRDFKAAFTRRGFKYFCKELDKDIGMEVKVEMTNDDALLRKSANGLFELFLLPSTGTLPRGGTLPRSSLPSSSKQAKNPQKTAMGVQDFAQRKRRSMQALNGVGIEGEGERRDWRTHASSITAQSLSTIVSRRAGEQLAEYTSTSEDPYHFDESTRMSSSLYDCVENRGGTRRRKKRVERYRKAYVPSTISSVTESSLSLPQIVEVFLPMKGLSNLGITVVCQDGNVYVCNVDPESAVGRDGRIEVGDQIIQVNKLSFEDLDEHEAVRVLREVASLKKPLTLFVAKRPTRLDRQDPLAALASETLPLDISLWVETAVQQNNRQQLLAIDSTMGESFNDFGPADDDTEEERELYEQRRHGRPRPMVVEEAERRRENEANEQLCERLSVHMDPWQIVRAMARPDSGLQIKNRKWLKIVVPMAFIGCELVDWLLSNVGDLPDRKAARRFASMLLEKGLIRHVVSKLAFSEQCYFIVNESILGVRAAGAETSGGTSTGREATTEVTYIGSPAPGGARFLGRGLDARRQMKPSLANETWPISPITMLGVQRRLDCESPLTNDYASMVDDLPGASWKAVRAPPPNTPLSATSAAYALLPPQPNPSPCETEFEECDDTRRILKN